MHSVTVRSRLNDAQKEKQKLMRVLRGKDEELEELNSKNDQLSSQLRTANSERRKVIHFFLQ